MSLDRYIDARMAALLPEPAPDASGPADDEFEACIEIAAAIKRSIRDSGLSRDQVVDGINAYFGRTKAGAVADPQTCRNPLSIHMLNNYLSKPAENPIQAYLLFPICHVTKSFRPLNVILSAFGARVATREEIEHMEFGKLDAAIDVLVEKRRKNKRMRVKKYAS